ncbi:MAG TPA: GNAT family N-acetyltransferase [Candidatus Limiplasma sp.]|nr:GNAT family N-acetyltransferase [Candidatus Limiplasma sp.]HPS81287.1 GNAT family N-acetyltransferase [Candidatus Limiplasma sp.]
MQVRALERGELPIALQLAWKVFNRFEAPEYSAEGTENFRKTIMDPAYGFGIRGYGAFDGETMVGMLATRNAGAHITLLFVEEAYHRKGIGRMLFDAAEKDAPEGAITVNASPYAVEAYRHLGFAATKPEQLTDGIRYTPMVYIRRVPSQANL